MNSIIVITPVQLKLSELLGSAQGKWSITDERDDHCVIEKGDSHLIVNLDQGILSDYDSNELELIRNKVPEPAFLMFEFNDFDFAKCVVRECICRDDVLVDDDHGHIGDGVEFLKRYQESSEV